ncbi:hypothetical protein I4U23_017165 [Adineta vaga]|nr:hypothetical protein I4U23_017165 [Adineta vaga]
MAPKSTSTRKKNIEKENEEQMVLIRDETSEVLMLVDSSKALPVKKGTQLAPGIVVSWQDNNRQRWRGPVLTFGTESHCSKIMSTIKRNSIINDPEDTIPKENEGPKPKSTIVIESRDTEQVLVNEEESNELSEIYSTDNENDKSSQDEMNDEEEIDEDTKAKNSPLIQTTDNPSSNRLKRRSQENSTSSTKKKKFSTSSLTVPYATYSKLEQKCLRLEAQLARYEQEYMPGPKDPKVIHYFIEVTDILRGVHNNEDDEDRENLFEMIIKELSMDEKQLLKCHSKTATATARQIMKHLYPIPTQECKDRLSDESFWKAVVKYTRLSNPADPTTDVEI